jgi:hypothetical protein
MDTEERKERRAIKVSDRAYRIFNYGAEIYNESVGDFVDRFIDWIEKKAKLPLSESLVEEGLKLIKEINPEKAVELRKKLESLKLPIFEGIEQKLPVS